MVQTPSKGAIAALPLQVPPTLQLSVTVEQFVTLAANNRELQLERTATGELIMNPPTGWETGRRNRSIIGQLDHWYEAQGQPGEAFDSSTAFTLPNGAIRSPDAAWVSPDRWNALTPDQKGTFANICPDFVVELRSGSDALKPLQTKMLEYMENGAKLGWLIDPQNRTVEVYRSGLAVEVLNAPTVVSGEAVLASFELDLKRVWR